MALGTFDVSFPNAELGQAGNIGEQHELTIPVYNGEVERVLRAESILTPHINVRSLKGTDSATTRAIGDSKLEKVVPGAAPNGSKTEVGRNTIIVDTMVVAREYFPQLDVFQSNVDVQMEVAQNHGEILAEFLDKTNMIAGIKAARSAQSAFAGKPPQAGKPDGHKGGHVQRLATAADRKDPELLYQAVKQAIVAMQMKKVNLVTAKGFLILNPEDWHTLADAEKLIRTDYITSACNKLQGVDVIKAYGLPVLNSVHLPQEVVTAHMLSNVENNGNFYDGDYSKVVGLMMSPRAVMAAQSVPLTAQKYWDDNRLTHVVGSYLSYAAGINRAEFAATIELPA